MADENVMEDEPKPKKRPSISSEISSGIRRLFDSIGKRAVEEIRLMSSRAEKDFRRLATSLFFFMLGSVFLAIAMVKILERHISFDASTAYLLVGLLLLLVSLMMKRSNAK